MLVVNDKKALREGEKFREARRWEIGDKVFEELLETYECYLGFCYPTLHHREIRERVWQELSEGKINLKTIFQMQGGRG